MLEFLKEPMVGSILGIAGIIIGVMLSIFFYFKSKIVANPKFTIDNINLIDVQSGLIALDVVMKYKDNQISTLNKTTVRFWNSGKKTIDKNDLVPEYMTIDFNKNNPSTTHFISCTVSNKRRDAIQVDLVVSENNNIDFNFNYLDYKDYFEIEILHTGKIIPTKIIGNIKGVPKGLINVSNKAIKLQEYTLDVLVGSTKSFILMSILGSLVSDLRHKKD